MTKYLNSIYMIIMYILKAFNKLHFCCLYVISSFRYFVFFVFSNGVISSLSLLAWLFSSFRLALSCREKTKRRHAKRRKDKITPCEKTKVRHKKKRKDATRKEDKIRVSNGVFSHGVFFVFSR